MFPGMEELGIEKARVKLRAIVDRARFKDIPTTITSYGEPVAVVVSLEFYERAAALGGQGSATVVRPHIRDTSEEHHGSGS